MTDRPFLGIDDTSSDSDSIEDDSSDSDDSIDYDQLAELRKLIEEADAGDEKAERLVELKTRRFHLSELHDFLQTRSELPVSAYLIARDAFVRMSRSPVGSKPTTDFIALYEKAAHLGSLHAAETLAVFCSNGLYRPYDPNKVIEFYTIAINRGSTASMIKLAYFYEKQEKKEKAMELYEKASEKGDHQATMHLILHYETTELIKAINLCLKIKDYNRVTDYFTSPKYQHLLTDEQLLTTLQDIPEDALIRLPRILNICRKLSDKELYELRMQHEYQPGGEGFEETKKEWMQLVTQNQKTEII